MSKSFEELQDCKRFLAEAAVELERAANLRAGQMDSQSRADEIAHQIRQTMVSVAARARALA
jgi:hypothetical protein